MIGTMMMQQKTNKYQEQQQYAHALIFHIRQNSNTLYAEQCRTQISYRIKGHTKKEQQPWLRLNLLFTMNFSNVINDLRSFSSLF